MNIIQRLKTRFKKEVPVASFKTKVQPYDRNKEYYCILYSTNGGLTWNEITEAILTYNDPYLWTLDHPVVSRSFEHAVDRAKSEFASVEQVRTHLAAQKAMYAAKLVMAKAKRAERDKVWES